VPLRCRRLDCRGNIVLASTHNWLEGAFWEGANMPERGYVVHHAPTSANPHLPPDEIAYLRSTLRPEVASQELDALFVDMGGATIFPLHARLFDGEPHSDAENNRSPLPLTAQRKVSGTRRPSSVNRFQIADGRPNPVETRSGNEAVVVEIQPIRSGLDASIDASRQAVGASDLAIEETKACAKELFGAKRRSTFFDHGRALLGPKPINAKNGAVANLADLVEIAPAERSFIDQDDAA
jgi:hypothetical protein